MTAGSTIDYEALTQEAMRGLVRTVLSRTAKSGLPGDHHFYISFDTETPGVALSKRLKEKYPREMTIVLQHRFWDLTVSDDRFEVKLTFDGIPERLVIPFAAIKVFFDPSVRYGLQFEDADLVSDASSLTGADFDTDVRTQRPTPIRKPRSPRKSRTERDGARDGVQDLTPALAPGAPTTDVLPTGSGRTGKLEPVAAKAVSDSPGDGKPAPNSGAEIVRLDKFRKK
jgi:hypothetical protein